MENQEVNTVSPNQDGILGQPTAAVQLVKQLEELLKEAGVQVPERVDRIVNLIALIFDALKGLIPEDKQGEINTITNTALSALKAGRAFEDELQKLRSFKV